MKFVNIDKDELDEDEHNFIPNPNPATVDDIVKAMDDRSIMGRNLVLKGLSLLRTKSIQQFNFGTVKLDVIRAAQCDAIDFVSHGHFQLPFSVCMYRVSVVYDNHIVGYSILCVDGRGSQVDGYDTDGVACIGIVREAHGLTMAMHAINMMRTGFDPRKLGELAVEIQVPGVEMDYWKRQMNREMKDNEELPSAFTEQITEGAILAMGLTMILNTKGVLKEPHAPAAKPQAARKKANRPPLPYVTRVYTDVYNRAAEPGTGTHASPRPHLRRAHLRHYPARGIREAYVLPMEAMLINWDGTPLTPRKTYEVK